VNLPAGRQRHNDVDAERAWLFSFFFFRSLVAIGLTAAIALMRR
jgi:hypothetical protein